MSRRSKTYFVWGLLILIGLMLLAWSFRTVSFDEILYVMRRLRPWQMGAVFAVNSLIVFLFPLRWWLILRAQGNRIPYIFGVRYRLTASALSYFSPGQHFGGEPLQVLMLRQRHQIPGSTGLASVTFDRAIEIFGNFAVLIIGISFLLASGVLDVAALRQALPISLGMMVVLVGYLIAVGLGWRPLARLTISWDNWMFIGLRRAEEQFGELTQKKPGLLTQGLGISAIVWGMLFFEFWLMVKFLGVALSGIQLVAIVVASRVALFAPTPGALGALEASQVFAFETLGFDPAVGLSLSLLIRARDIVFSALGLLWHALSRT